MDLLTDQQRADIKAALHDVTDTFFKTPITYKFSKGNLNRFAESGAGETFQDYSLLAQVEYADDDNDRIKRTVDGVDYYADIQLTLNYADMVTAGLIGVDGISKIQVEKDKFVNTETGVSYYMSWMGYDGFFDEKPVLVVIHGILNPRKAGG